MTRALTLQDQLGCMGQLRAKEIRWMSRAKDKRTIAQFRGSSSTSSIQQPPNSGEWCTHIRCAEGSSKEVPHCNLNVALLHQRLTDKNCFTADILQGASVSDCNKAQSVTRASAWHTVRSVTAPLYMPSLVEYLGVAQNTCFFRKLRSCKG